MNKQALDRVKEIIKHGCIICGIHVVQIHHVRRYGEKRDDMKTVCLCYNHHMGSEGIHHLGKKEFERRYMTQDDMLAKTEELLK